MHRVAKVTLSSIKQVISEVKRGYPARFGLKHSHSLLDIKGVSTALEEGVSTKVPGTELSHWELICDEFSDAFKPAGTPPKRAIKHDIVLLPDFVPLTKR